MRGQAKPQPQPRNDRLIGDDGLRPADFLRALALRMQGFRQIERGLPRQIEQGPAVLQHEHAFPFVADANGCLCCQQFHGYSLKIRFAPLSHCTVMSPPFGVVGNPVAVSMKAIRSFVASVPGVLL